MWASERFISIYYMMMIKILLLLLAFGISSFELFGTPFFSLHLQFIHLIIIYGRKIGMNRVKWKMNLTKFSEETKEKCKKRRYDDIFIHYYYIWHLFSIPFIYHCSIVQFWHTWEKALYSQRCGFLVLNSKDSASMHSFLILSIRLPGLIGPYLLLFVQTTQRISIFAYKSRSEIFRLHSHLFMKPLIGQTLNQDHIIIASWI